MQIDTTLLIVKQYIKFYYNNLTTIKIDGILLFMESVRVYIEHDR